jgi:hypothetical protein
LRGRGRKLRSKGSKFNYPNECNTWIGDGELDRGCEIENIITKIKIDGWIHSIVLMLQQPFDLTTKTIPWMTPRELLDDTFDFTYLKWELF